ncbi:hypothetical protein Tco_1359904 [Tanacetum coccineum]
MLGWGVASQKKDKGSATSRVYSVAVYVRNEALKEADTKEFATKQAVMMKVDMKEADMREVNVKDVGMDEEDMKKA